MKEWWSASDLVGTPCLPRTRQGISLRAKRNFWKCRKRQGGGGGMEYHYSSLPRETLVALGLKDIDRKDRLEEMEQLINQVKGMIDRMLAEERS